MQGDLQAAHLMKVPYDVLMLSATLLPPSPTTVDRRICTAG